MLFATPARMRWRGFDVRRGGAMKQMPAGRNKEAVIRATDKEDRSGRTQKTMA